MSRRPLILFIAFFASACAGRGPGVLPPAPKTDVLAFADRIQIVAAEGEVVVVDTTAPRVIDAGSMDTVRLPREDRKVEAPRDEWDNLVPRFRGERGGQEADPVARARATADSILEARTPWVSLQAAADSIAFHKPWRAVEQRMLAGAEIPIRALVWPTPVRVVERSRGHIRLATDWVDFSRISRDEMRCVSVEDARDQLEGDNPAVRLIANVLPIEGGSARIVVRWETRAVAGCTISPLGTDRLAAFRLDIWNVMNRVGAIGVPGTSIIR